MLDSIYHMTIRLLLLLEITWESLTISLPMRLFYKKNGHRITQVLAALIVSVIFVRMGKMQE